MNDVDDYNPDAVSEAQEQLEQEKQRTEDAFRAQVDRLRMAYIRVFKEGTPTPEDRDLVLADLEIFTRGERTPWSDNERVHCLLTGRHEVYSRIKHHTTLSLDALLVEKLTPKA